jgi:hypothetical protein
MSPQRFKRFKNPAESLSRIVTGSGCLRPLMPERSDSGAAAQSRRQRNHRQLQAFA